MDMYALMYDLFLFIEFFLSIYVYVHIYIVLQMLHLRLVDLVHFRLLVLLLVHLKLVYF